MKTSPYFSGSQSTRAKSGPSLKLQRSSITSSQKEAGGNSSSECLRRDDVKSTPINRVRPGKDAHVLSSFKLHGEVDVQTAQNDKLASCLHGTPDVGKLSGKLDVPGSSPANPVCIGTRFQLDESDKVSLSARFNAVGSTSAQTKADMTFSSASFVDEDDDIEGIVQVLGEPPRTGSRKRQLCKAVDRVFDDSGAECVKPTEVPGRAGNSYRNSRPFVEDPEDLGKKRTRKAVVREVKNSTETSESKGSIHGRDDICKEAAWEDEFSIFANRKSTQSLTTMQVNFTAAMNALEDVASKGQILHVEKIPARYFRFMFQTPSSLLLYALILVVSIEAWGIISDWGHRADLRPIPIRISSFQRSFRKLFREGNTETRLFDMIYYRPIL